MNTLKNKKHVFIKRNANYIISFLGQDQDELGGSFEKQQSLSGILSNINIWSKILTDKEVERMSKCFGKDMIYPLDLLKPNTVRAPL